jgi:hypothetical protein
VNDAPLRPFGRGGGAEGNERLTSTVGLALVVLLAVEAATTLSHSTYLDVRIFPGLVFQPPARHDGHRWVARERA